MTMTRIITFFSAATLIAASDATAQDQRLAARFDNATVQILSGLIHEARGSGLPTEPLVQKALEGASKRAPAHAIVAAVRTLSAQLAQSRTIFGADAAAGVLLASAAALEEGATIDDLKQLSAYANDAALPSAIVGLTFLIQQGVDPSRGTPLVAGMLKAKLDARDFVTLQRLIDQDMRTGAGALQSARTRADAMIRHGNKLRTTGTDDVL